jgi:hypothetical protein
MWGSSFRLWLGLALGAAGFLGRMHLAFAFGFGLVILDQFLPMLIRCRVCGLRTWTSSQGLTLNVGDREEWVLALDACPVCGDDGEASERARAEWRASGRQPEPPYWSLKRILIAILFAVAFIGGGLTYALHQRVVP